jgi:cytochrome P450
LDAVKNLQGWLAERLEQLEDSRTKRASACPFMGQADSDDQRANGQSFNEDDMVAHLLVFTSSIANKAVASLLTAYLMNLFLWRDGGGDSSLAHLIRSQEDEATKERMLESILAETERLSPPVVGVMRCVKQEIALHHGMDGKDENSEYTIQKGHDAWLYLAGASRDPTVFKDADVFSWDRYMSTEDGELNGGFAFGGGVKKCLGYELTRQISLTVARTLLGSQLSFEATVSDRGVRHWLGWEKNVPLEVIAKDLKQLPCQRPRKPVKVEVILDS